VTKSGQWLLLSVTNRVTGQARIAAVLDAEFTRVLAA